MTEDSIQESQLNPDEFDINKCIDEVKKESSLLLMFDMKKKTSFEKIKFDSGLKPITPEKTDGGLF